MKKVEYINLAGFPFTIDVDAYDLLDRYLDSIDRHFSASEGHEEIVSDIETRLAELFQEQVGNQGIITQKEVKTAITIMGRPEEFGADPIDLEEDPFAQQANEQKTTHQRTRTKNRRTNGRDFGIYPGKRLFRDEEDKVIGGVSSGLAAYFGISDPIWVRLVLLASFFMGGFGIVAYIIAMIIIPKATTAADRLAMRGEPINVKSISTFIETEMNNLGEKMTEVADSFTNKKKETTTPPNPQTDEVEDPSLDESLV